MKAYRFRVAKSAKKVPIWALFIGKELVWALFMALFHVFHFLFELCLPFLMALFSYTFLCTYFSLLIGFYCFLPLLQIFVSF